VNDLRDFLPVIIPAYQRPEKLIKRYEEIIGWSNLSKLYISVDGPRSGAGPEEVLRNRTVLSTAEEIGSRDNRIELLVWDSNSGVNDHTAKLFNATLNSKGIIIIEDDVGITHQTLNFLADNYRRDGSMAAAAHVKRSHLNISPVFTRTTVFPNQWGLALTSEVMSCFIDIHKSRKFERRVIQRVFHKALKEHLSIRKIEMLTQFWFNHFYFCAQNMNWADAIIQYSVYASQGFYRVPASSLIIDDNEMFDQRSMNPRTDPNQFVNCDMGETASSIKDYSCLTCELDSSCINEAKVKNLIASTKHRSFIQLRSRLKYPGFKIRDSNNL